MLVTSIPQYVQGLTNAKLDLTSTAATVLYTAPSSADFNASVVNSIIVSNYSGSSDTITLTVTNGSDAFSLFNVKAVAANTSIELLTRDLILQEGEILKATAATADRLHIVASIQEFAIHRTPQVDL
jgi:indole-3-glycerol phosphate synthase